MKKLIFIFLFLQMSVQAYGQSQTTELKWYLKNGVPYCGEYVTELNTILRDMSDSVCRERFPTQLKWYLKNGIPYCGEYVTELNTILRDMGDSVCRGKLPMHVKWYLKSGVAYCGEYTAEGWLLRDVSDNICRSEVKSQQPAKPVPKPPTVAEINSQLQPAENSQIIIGADIAVPRKAGCGAPKDSNTNVQCYICQKKVTHNSTLYSTKDEIIQIGRVSMIESRVDIVMELLDADDLGTILCRSKYNSAITDITNLDGLVKTLESSGIKFKDPGYLVKKINRTSAPAAAGQLMEYEGL